MTRLRRSHLIPRLVLAVVVAAGLQSCAGGAKAPVPPPIVPPSGPAPIPAQAQAVRVGILVQVDDVQVGATDSYSLMDEDGVLLMGTENEVVNVRREGDRLAVYTPAGELIDTAAGTLHLEPRDPAAEVLVNGARYPGSVDVRMSPEGGLNAINITDVETYLRAVVPLEIGHQGDGLLEAAKAQAVAARTYVAGHLDQYPQEGFDLYAGVTDQVYGPVDRRHPDSDRAVAETAGLILIYDGKPIRANYASTCGGRTAGAEESFDSDPIPYLQSHEDVVDGLVACRTSRYYRWEETWTGEELRKVLSATVPRVLGQAWHGAVIRGLEVVEKGKSGRAIRLRITTDKDVYEAVKGQIRQVLETSAGRPLLSTAFDLEVWKKEERIRMVVARGRGWGHGVGMCQWGAMQLSRDGYGFRTILGHYYPGTQLKLWYGPGPATAGERTSTGE